MNPPNEEEDNDRDDYYWEYKDKILFIFLLSSNVS